MERRQHFDRFAYLCRSSTAVVFHFALWAMASFDPFEHQVTLELPALEKFLPCRQIPQQQQVSTTCDGLCSSFVPSLPDRDPHKSAKLESKQGAFHGNRP
jgi:hypothetical protein